MKSLTASQEKVSFDFTVLGSYSILKSILWSLARVAACGDQGRGQAAPHLPGTAAPLSRRQGN